MLTEDQWMDVKLMQKQGMSIRQIAEASGHSRNTVRKILRTRSRPQFQQPPRASKLDPYKDYIRQRYTECALSSVRLVEEIRAMGYTGSIDTVRRYRATLSREHAANTRATVRFETPPAHQAQCDWTYCGKHLDAAGNLIAIYAYLIVLGYSRMMYVEFTTSMKLPVLIECHKRAFEFFGGWTATILYDNMKQVRDGAQLNKSFADFADHYGFVPKTHQPYRPRTKGKVERPVDYVKGNFLNGRTFHGLDDLNAQAMHWLNHTANVRVHGTTGEQPAKLFAHEQPLLTPLAWITPYQLVVPHPRKVSAESMVHFGSSTYSVPPEFIGRTVEVTSHGGRITIKADQMILADHAAAARAGQQVMAPQHIEALCRMSLNRPQAPCPNWTLNFTESVEQRPLCVYQEAAA